MIQLFCLENNNFLLNVCNCDGVFCTIGRKLQRMQSYTKERPEIKWRKPYEKSVYNSLADITTLRKKKLKLKHELNGRTNDTTILKKDVFYSAHINTHFMCFLSAPVKINRKHRVHVI